MGEIQYMSFPHNAVEICEVFENRCNESYALVNGTTEILSIFSGRLYSMLQYICYISTQLQTDLYQQLINTAVNWTCENK
jgi:predicted site-specific integrase-resolvase